MSNKQSHPEEFIAKMRGRLEAEEKQLRHELQLTARQEKGDFKAKYPEYGRHEDENADEIADYTARAGTVEATETRLENVTAALAHVDEGTYGLTVNGDLIPQERLSANPAATTLIPKTKAP